jgi:hypothetical protein
MKSLIVRVALLVMTMSLVSCAAIGGKERAAPEKITLSFDAQNKQYMCVSPVYLSEATKSFILSLGDNNHTVALGTLLDQAVQKIFWKDANAAASGRANPIVMLGFDGGTGAYRDSTLYVRISLQFQIFKPTGQSYIDLAVGESSSQTASDSSDAAVVNDALQQSLGRLAGILTSAGICRAVQ